MIRALIVDDERLARAEIRRLLCAHPEIEIVGEAASVGEAAERIEQDRPDLLLLDVQMPDGSGFDLLSGLNEVPQVIFTTAYDSYAIKAFEANALDYLQKPIEAKRLAAALQRVSQRQDKSAPALSGDSRIFIRDGNRCWFVKLDDIVLFESEGNYTRVYFDTYRPLILRTLSHVEARLGQTRFYRANRRQVVNLDFVASATPAQNGGIDMKLKNGLLIELSRKRAAELKGLASL